MANFFWSCFSSANIIITTSEHHNFPIFWLKFIAVIGLIASLLFCWKLRKISSLILYLSMAFIIGINRNLMQVHYAFLGVTFIYLTFFYSEIENQNVIRIKNKEFHTKFLLLLLFMSSYTISGVSKFYFANWINGIFLQSILTSDRYYLAPYFSAFPLSFFKSLSLLVAILEALALPLHLWKKTRFALWMAILFLHTGIALALPKIFNISSAMILVQLFYFYPALYPCDDTVGHKN